MEEGGDRVALRGVSLPWAFPRSMTVIIPLRPAFGILQAVYIQRDAAAADEFSSLKISTTRSTRC